MKIAAPMTGPKIDDMPPMITMNTAVPELVQAIASIGMIRYSIANKAPATPDVAPAITKASNWAR
ncbi:hypothetical protein D9M69_639810 [compost metagenome]